MAGASVAQRLDTWLSGYPDIVARRLLHKAPVLLWRLGLGRLVGRPLMLLTTTGRTSGRPRHTPLAAHRMGGRTYAWCPYGGRGHWYRNLTANPVVTVQTAEGARSARAVRIDDDAEVADLYGLLKGFDAALLHRYLESEGIADSVSDVVANKGRLHLVRLAPTLGPGPDPLKADLPWVWALPAFALLWTIANRLRSA